MEQELDIAPAVSLQEYIAIIRRRRSILVQSFVLISVVGLVVTLMTKPVYHASARLLVDGPSYNLNTVDTQNPLSSLFVLGQQQTVDTQVEVLQAQPLLDKVVAQTGPASLTVTSIRDTNVIEVDSEANDSKVAAGAANTLLDDYVSEDADQSLNEIKSAEAFVDKGGAKARKSLSAAEQELMAFKQAHHVVEVTKDRDNKIMQVTNLTDSAQRAQTDLAALRAQIAQSKRLLAQEPEMTSATLATTNTNIASLQGQIRALQVQRQGLMQPGGFTDKSPQIQALDGQIRTLQTQLARQPGLTMSQASSPNITRQGLHSNIINLQAQEASLQTQTATFAVNLALAQTQVGHFADWEVQLARLQRAHDNAAAETTRYADEREDLNLREQARHAPARIIERAQAPSSPIRPKKVQSLFLACIIGLCVGVCLALMQEFLDDRINTTEDADRLLGLPSLGLVPALSVDDARLLPQMQGLDPAAESYRILRTNIHFAAIDTPLRTLMVTSSSPGEGKTTTAANLAFAMAIDGKRVILVDTDLRRPSVHKLLELPVVPGITDVLLGHATLDDAVLQNEDLPNLSALTAGSTPPNPAELLGSRTFRNLVDQLTQRADIVIFDTPPVLAAADSQILAAQLDGVVLVVETGETRKGAARQTLKMLRQARANILGIAYNNLPGNDGEAKVRELTTVEIFHLFDEIADAGCLWLQLTGGEVLMRPDFEEIYLYAKRKGFLIRLFTNGTMLTPKIADLLAAHRPFAVEISLYGATEETYEAVTRVPGSYHKCLRGIRLLLDRKLPLTLKTVAITLNHHEMPQLQAFCDALGVKFRYDPDINPRLDGDKTPLQYRLSPAQVVAMDAATPPRARELTDAVCAAGTMPDAGIDAPLFDCAAGETAFHIDPYGRLSVCIMTRLPDYDLRQETGSFARAWHEVFPGIRAQTRRTGEENPAGYHHCTGWAQLENHGDGQATVVHAALVARLRAKAFAKTESHRRADSGLLLTKSSN